MTVVAVAAGAALGARVGFAVGAVAALVSNFYLGQGVWTPWQMLAWGGCGVVGALAAASDPEPLGVRGHFASRSALRSAAPWTSGTGTASGPTPGRAHTLVYARGVWFSAFHAIGNVIFAVVIGPELRRLLERYGRRLRIEVAWA